jgi:hypothetical protein
MGASMLRTVQLPTARGNRLALRGHFDQAVCGVYQASPQDCAATTSHFGLSLYMNTQWGTFRDDSGTWYNSQRVVENECAAGMALYRSGDTGLMPESGRCHAGMCRWWIEGDEHITQNFPAHVPTSGHNPEPGGFSSEPLRVVQSANQGTWHEGEVMSVSGPVVAAIQWYVPAGDGGMLMTTQHHRVIGTILGKRVRGFYLNGQIYLRRGLTYAMSEYFNRIEVTLVTGGTEYDDGTIEVFQLGLGRDGFAFAVIADQNGVVHQTTNVSGVMERHVSGDAAHVSYNIDGEAWEWICDNAPELHAYGQDEVNDESDIPAYRASEGRVRRVGDTREPFAWMAYNESFADRG